MPAAPEDTVGVLESEAAAEGEGREVTEPLGEGLPELVPVARAPVALPWGVALPL